MFVINKDYNNTNIPRTIRFNETIYRQLMRVAEEEGVSFNSVVLQCCRYALDSWVKNDSNPPETQIGQQK